MVFAAIYAIAFGWVTLRYCRLPEEPAVASERILEWNGVFCSVVRVARVEEGVRGVGCDDGRSFWLSSGEMCSESFLCEYGVAADCYMVRPTPQP